MSAVTKKSAKVTFTQDEVKKGALIGVDVSSIKATFQKYAIPEALAEKLNAELNEVLQAHLAKLDQLRPFFDADNGEGSFDRLQASHSIKVSVWGAKMQGKNARLQLVANGTVPAELMEKADDAPVASDETLDIELDI